MSKFALWAGWGSAAAIGVVAVAAATGLVDFRALFGRDAPAQRPETQAVATPAPQPPEVASSAAPRPQAPQPDPGPEIAPLRAPGFDLVRVDPQGLVVVAGYGEVSSRVSILVDGGELGEAEVGADGKFVSLLELPPVTVPRIFTLRQTLGDRVLDSEQEVILAPPPVDVARLDPAPLPETPADGAETPADPVAAPVSPEPAAPDVAAPGPEAESRPEPDAGDAVAAAPTTAVPVASLPAQDEPLPDPAPESAAPAPVEPVVASASPDAPRATPADPAPQPVEATREAASQPEEASPEAPAPESPTPEAPAPEAPIPESPTPEAPAAAPDAPIPPAPADATTVTAAVDPAIAARTAPDIAEAADTPGAPAVFLSSTEGVEVLTTDPLAPGDVALDAISYDDSGDVLLSGRGESEAFVRVYLDNTPVTTSRIRQDGRWRITLPEVDTGTYTLRVDQIDAAGAVMARVESPFLRESAEALEAAAALGPQGPIKAITVQPGHTLWAIARDRYGEGLDYVRVYQANRDRIRDPDLIYPGQIFDLPDG